MTNQDSNLFKEEILGVKPLKQDRFFLQPQSRIRKSAIKEYREQEDTLFYFSDEYEPLLNENDGVVKYLREGEEAHLLKRLRRGDFSPELFLDLHGLTREQAKLELASLLQVCEKERLDCASIMTGYGSYTLKRQIPRWLVQHPKVRALHQAPKEWGGDAAILILIEV
ncbi:endonuclease SmrB [Rodentibacter caecimuris]|uniref:Ribosome rescue factor SmrB n=1 Tax=Rodentibacter caecimuris TaxID=1796644 RepID=A0ABX3KXF0_9PAST|nr:hypothetical protein BKG89_07225 [Rodentibacter heylii]